MFKKIPKIAVYAVLFLIPIFTLPFTSNVLDFQKQFLLFVITSLGFLFWAWGALSEKKLAASRSPLHFFVAAFVAITLISSIFSLYSYGSLWGNPLPVAESFITVFSFALLYLLIVNNFKKEESYELVAVAAVSASIAAVYAVIQSFGFYILPFLSYTKSQAFNTIGTTNSLSLYAAIILAAIFPMVLTNKNPYRRLMTVCGSLLFLTIVFFNSVVTVYFPSKIGSANYDLSLTPWIVLVAGALAAFIFSVSNSKFSNRNVNIKNGSFALLFVALLFVVFNVFAKDMVAGIWNRGGSASNQSMEAALHQQTAAGISIDVLKQSTQSFFLGSGPGTFIYDYVKFKPQSVNQDSIGWNLTFFAGASEAVNRIATTGLLGLIAFLLIIGIWTSEGFRSLTNDGEESVLPLAVFSGWVAIAVALFYYPFNLSLMMLFWLFLGLIIIMDGSKFVVLPLKSVRLSYAISLIFVSLTILELGLLVWTAKRYYAEVEYLAAANALQNNDLTGAVKDLETATNSTDRLQDNYLTGLSQIYLAQAQQELSKKDAKPEDALKAAAPYLKTAVDAAMLSTDSANPSNSTNWAVRGYIYRQLIGVSDGFDTWAVNMYQKAVSMDPSNPSLWTEIGQVYMKKNDLDKAKESFNKAISLRAEYIDPHYYLALIDDQQGDKAGAISELETISQLLPSDDKTSRDNIAQAIQNLKDGKSLSGSEASGQQPAAPSPDGSQLLPGAVEGQNGSSTESVAPAETNKGTQPVPAVKPAVKP